jgi:hypothetical protein
MYHTVKLVIHITVQGEKGIASECRYLLHDVLVDRHNTVTENPPEFSTV